MPTPNKNSVSKPYVLLVLLLMLILPVTSTIISYYNNKIEEPLIMLSGRWFIFWGLDIRLLTAGLRQAFNPAFTAEKIFHISDKQSFAVVRELGFANICMGAVATVSLFLPQWRTAAAFTGGLFMGIAGIMHIIKKPAGVNEWVAMVSDLFIFLVVTIYVITAWQ